MPAVLFSAAALLFLAHTALSHDALVSVSLYGANTTLSTTSSWLLSKTGTLFFVPTPLTIHRPYRDVATVRTL